MPAPSASAGRKAFSRSSSRALIGVAVLLLVAVAGAAFVIHNNERELARRATALTGGDPYDGKEALLRYGWRLSHDSRRSAREWPGRAAARGHRAPRLRRGRAL
jgi:hypothetical protein